MSGNGTPVGVIPSEARDLLDACPDRVEKITRFARDDRVGLAHRSPSDLPWLWANFGQSNTIVLAGMPRGQHEVLIELVDAEGNVFTAQTVTFQSPGKEGRP